MKYLILGIDGGDLSTFEAFKMPFLEQLISNDTSIELNEDLFSRGWVEIISGKHGSEHNGFYLRPKLGGTKEFTLSYSFSDLKKNINSDLIWELVEKKGFKSGTINVPTTYPSPSVEGFFVSGAGGGLTKVDGIPDEMVSSDWIKQVLEDHNYILDLRLKPSGITEINLLFDKLEEMLINRVKSFIALVEKQPVDFGFIAFRAPVVVTYLATYEIERIRRGESKKGEVWHDRLTQFYSIFDDQIKLIFEKLSPENHIVTADHGTRPQKFHVNYNVFLEESGFLKKNYTVVDRVKWVLKRVRKALKNPMGFNYINSTLGEVDYQNSKVFANWYYNGLYVNDESRFGGPIKEDQIDEVVNQVCDRFNAYGPAKEFGMKARPYRKNFTGVVFNGELPDIWIDAPDECYHFGKNKNFVDKSPWYRKISTLKYVPSSMFTGTKGRNPICIMNKELSELIAEDDDMDLTLIYHLTKRYFEGIK